MAIPEISGDKPDRPQHHERQDDQEHGDGVRDSEHATVIPAKEQVRKGPRVGIVELDEGGVPVILCSITLGGGERRELLGPAPRYPSPSALTVLDR